MTAIETFAVATSLLCYIGCIQAIRHGVGKLDTIDARCRRIERELVPTAPESWEVTA